MGNTRIVVIGGSAAGAKAAAKARRMDENAEVTIIQKGQYLSMASCGYPYYVGGTFDNRNMLICAPTGVVRDPEFFYKAKKIKALTSTEAIWIDREKKQVLCRSQADGKEFYQQYDKLIIATGALANLPPIANLQLSGISTMLTMEDTDYLRKIRDERKIDKAVVIGGGLIGVETCEALQLSGFSITVVEMLPQLLPFLDLEMARLVENHMKAKGVTILTKTGVTECLGENGKVVGVKLTDGSVIDTELVVLAVGVKPNVALALEAGIDIGPLGGISVNAFMQTSDPSIYAAGDCVEIPNLNGTGTTLSPMGDLANLEGRVAGENVIAGNTAEFPGTYHTGICKIFDFSAGSTGLSEKRIAQEGNGLDVVTIINASPDKPGFMGAKLLISKLIVDRHSEKILGYQSVGPGDVSKQIASAAMAIQGGMSLSDLINLDLPYAPPFSLAIDHFIASAHIMQNKLKGRFVGISAAEVHAKLAAGEKPFLIDGRTPQEYQEMRLDIGEKLIPIGALRTKLDELPQDKDAEIICFCKVSLRGYEASLILAANGYTNVKVMEGGIMAWPFGIKMG